MDPFTIVTGTVGVTDVCLRLGKLLRDVGKTAKHLKEEVGALDQEIRNFRDVYDALREICPSAEVIKHPPARRSQVQDPGNRLWAHAAEVTVQGQAVIEELDALLTKIVGTDDSSPNKLDEVKKAVKLIQKNDNFKDLKTRLEKKNIELNTMLTAIHAVSLRNFRLEVFESIDKIPQKVSDELQLSILGLKTQLDSLRNSDDTTTQSISIANEAIDFVTLNTHFEVKALDIRIWTGRRTHLEKVKEALLPQTPTSVERQQRRFVIHGIAGSGKTQFCSKFAQDYRESFWGIFWIDATSPQSATESWKKIAKLGGKDPNEEAGKYWLSNHQLPWLLIIDSADGFEDSIRSNFPSGDRGYILITTRNPRLVTTATVGDMSLESLEENEADDLLRKVTYHKPWDESAKSAAAAIAKRLGYLPLALVHAGKAIMHQFCTLQDYIPFYNKSLSSFRYDRASPIIVGNQVLGKSALESFEIIYEGLESKATKATPDTQLYRDAVELIQIFSCFHCNEIRLETLIRAGSIIKKETENRKSSSNDAQEASKPVMQRLKKWAIDSLQQDPILPHIFQSVQKFDVHESEADDEAEPLLVRKISKTSNTDLEEAQVPTFAGRTRRAVDLLVRMAMVSESSEAGCYSMHPLVHDWVRQRLSLAQQALWCQAAINVLAGSVKLPPLVQTDGDKIYSLQILSHVEHVRKAQVKILDAIKKERNRGQESILTRLRFMLTGFLRLSQPAPFSRIDAGNCAKFSRVYHECGKLEDAETLLRSTLDFLLLWVGDLHPMTIFTRKALSGALFLQGRTAEAKDLLEKALDASNIRLGPEHPQTLRLMDMLGEINYQTWQLREAIKCHKSASEGMEHKEGMQRDYYKALDNLGRVHRKYFEYDVAHALISKAMDGLEGMAGEGDLDALVAMDNLSMCLLSQGSPAGIVRANELMEKVLHHRRAKLGEEHLFTLLAKANFSRTLARRGYVESKPELITEAKALISEALEIATRNVGENHIGTLFGRQHLAHFKFLEGNYQEAESEFIIVMEKQGKSTFSRNGTSADRLETMDLLAQCYAKQGKLQEAADVCGQMAVEFGLIGHEDHPAALYSAKVRKDFLELINHKKAGQAT